MCHSKLWRLLRRERAATAEELQRAHDEAQACSALGLAAEQSSRLEVVLQQLLDWAQTQAAAPMPGKSAKDAADQMAPGTPDGIVAVALMQRMQVCGNIVTVCRFFFAGRAANMSWSRGCLFHQAVDLDFALSGAQLLLQPQGIPVTAQRP
jgi:hypothetical protein